jgi:hypothetical protein
MPFQRAGDATVSPIFKSGSLITWFVDTCVTAEHPQARVGIKVDDTFLGSALLIPPAAFPIVPALCAGGANGASRHAVQLLHQPQAVDRSQASKRALLSRSDRVITCASSWSSAFLQHQGMSTGKYDVYWKLLSAAPPGAVCVGVADKLKFQVTARNVGADSHSWGYSSAGKLSAAKSGEFRPYGVPFKQGDIVGMHLDADSRQLHFSVNGTSQGSALKGALDSVQQLMPAICVGSSRSGTPHFVKLLPSLTAEQVAYALKLGWRESWAPTFNNEGSWVAGRDGTALVVNAPQWEALASNSTSPSMPAAESGAGAATE